MTTETKSSIVEPEEVTDALDLIQMAIEVQSLEGLRAVWECWDECQQQQIWARMGELLRGEVEAMLKHIVLSENSPPMMSLRSESSRNWIDKPK